ncbi:MAG: organomercurial lyase [Acidimicrobiia bacterium]|jgi:hypothetical protein
MIDLAEQVRHAIYSQLASRGTAPSPSDVAGALHRPTELVERAFDDLAAGHHIVLANGYEVVLAHPFATVNLGFSVMGRSTLWWGGCIWDSFAIPHLVPSDDEALVATTCQGCGAAHSWVVTTGGPPEDGQVAHFLVPMAHVWDDVMWACGNQRVFCGEDCLDRWLAHSGLERGHVTDLASVWRLASHWYDGRLDSPYVRRKPAEAADYFRSVGLNGPFWGN